MKDEGMGCRKYGREQSSNNNSVIYTSFPSPKSQLNNLQRGMRTRYFKWNIPILHVHFLMVSRNVIPSFTVLTLMRSKGLGDLNH